MKTEDCEPSGSAFHRGMADLVTRAAEGEPDAMTKLHRHLYPVVERTVRTVLRDCMLAEDVTQEVFVWLWMHADQFDPGRGSVAGWVATVARRRAIDAVRRETTWRRNCFLSEDAAIGTGNQIDDWEEAQTLQSSMALLNQGQREALVMTYLCDQTQALAAHALKLRICTVKSRVHDGLVMLRTLMAVPAG